MIIVYCQLATAATQANEPAYKRIPGYLVSENETSYTVNFQNYLTANSLSPQTKDDVRKLVVDKKMCLLPKGK